MTSGIAHSDALNPPRLLTPPYPQLFRGSALALRVLQAFGWRVRYQGFPARQGVAIIYPHTSNWDFVVMLLTKWAVGISVSFWGKGSLFDIPLLGVWLRWLGGIPLDRSTPRGAVGDMVDRFAACQREDQWMWLALSPEGTRRRTPGWRSGFYQVACRAEVPVALIRLDYRRKTVDVSHFARLSGDADADYALMASVYRDVQGRYPLQASPVAPLGHPS